MRDFIPKPRYTSKIFVVQSVSNRKAIEKKADAPLGTTPRQL